MLAKYKKFGLVVLSGALLATLALPADVWARGGGGRAGGGGGSRGGYGGGDRGGYNGGDRGSFGGNRGVNGGANPAVSHPNNFNANANAGFGARHFNNTNNWNGANANRLGANGYANGYRADGAIGPYGAGYGGLGYGALGAGLGYGAGYPMFGMYGMGGYGYGGGYSGYSNGGYSNGGYSNTSAGGTNYATDDSGYANTAATVYNDTAPTDDQVTSAAQFDAKGEADFKAGNYQAAVQDWQHVLIDTPHNGGDMLLLAQGLFATGQYQPAAGAVQLGMQMLPQDQWGTVIKHHTDLYATNNAFTEQLRALETARTAKPDDPALRFLLGYQYGYLGYPTQAIKELDKSIALRPQDRGAIVMRNLFAAQANVPALPLPPLPAATGTPTAQPVSTTNPAS